MAPIKFEENIKDKLEKRTLKPSENAWGKLSDRLNNQEESRNNKPYWWIGLAASIVGVLFVVSQFLIKETKTVEPIIVENPTEVIENKISNMANENDTVLEEEKAITTFQKEENNVVLKVEKISKVETEKQPVLVTYDNELVLQEDIKLENTPDVFNEKITFEEEKIQQVVAQVSLMKSENKVVTEAYLDSLLVVAQREIQLNRLYNNESTGIVDANALLQDVEAELDQSFRSKVFEALKSSYNSVKTAVAQRND